MSANEGKLDRNRMETKRKSKVEKIPEEEIASRKATALAEGDEETKPKVDKITVGVVRRQKRGIFKKLRDFLVGEDTVNVGEYVLYDVLIPSAKDLIRDMILGGVEMRLYGDRKGRRTNRDRGRSYVSYSSYYNEGKDRDKPRELSRANRARHDFDDIILETRGEAEEVLSHLVDLCIDYGQASVADLYDAVGITTNFTDNKYGWIDLKNASVSRVRGGYLINLPRTQQID